VNPSAATIQSGQSARHRHSPLIRRLARELALNPDDIPGTGPGGRVTRTDVTRAGAATSVAPEAHPVVDAYATCVVEVDVPLSRIHDGVTLHAIVVSAVADAACVDGGFGPQPVRIGIGLDSGDGMVVPFVADAPDLNPTGLTRRITDLERRARGRALTADELGPAPVTVTDLGGLGILLWSARPAAGQLASLAIGAAVDRPVVIRRSDGEAAIAIRRIAHLSLSYDPSAMDALKAARFLAQVKARVEQGES
jgi:pyruvate/2-oxoglutarate dehydrogenase complex dihydrolipoamide acyltransferase (E2) component